MTTKTTVQYRTEKRKKAGPFKKYINVPYLKFGGLYLEKAGFKIGDSVQIEIYEDEIILRKHSPAFLKMAAKNANLLKMVAELDLIEVAA